MVCSDPITWHFVSSAPIVAFGSQHFRIRCFDAFDQIDSDNMYVFIFPRAEYDRVCVQDRLHACHRLLLPTQYQSALKCIHDLGWTDKWWGGIRGPNPPGYRCEDTIQQLAETDWSTLIDLTDPAMTPEILAILWHFRDWSPKVSVTFHHLLSQNSPNGHMK